MPERSGVTVKLKVGGSPISVLDGVTTTIDNKVYSILDLMKRIMSPDNAITVKDNGVPTTERLEIDKLNGTIKFASENPGRVITVDYKYVPTTEFAEAYNCTVNETAELSEVNKFGKTHKERIVVSKDVEVEISHWDNVDTYFVDAVKSGAVVFLQVEEDEGAYSTYSLITEADNLEIDTSSVQSKKISLKGTVI